MSNSIILYIGEREAGESLAALAELRNSFVFQPDDLMQALGMYITYFPDIIVIDSALDYADEVFDHLRSVDAKPILLLTDQRVRTAGVYTLPREASAEALLERIERIDEPQTVLNGVLRYA